MMAATVHSPGHLAIITDAWLPQTNGVVRSLQATIAMLEARGWRITLVTPQDFASLPCPTYPEIRLSLPRPGAIGRILDAAAPDFIHISTEGPLGLAARRWCVRRGLHFTTAFHTKFPDYVKRRTRLPLAWSYGYMRWFHRPSSGVMCATPSLDRELMARRVTHLRRWTRGVDTELYHPGRRTHAFTPAILHDLPRPILLYVGRVAVEKNVEAFLRLDYPGTKLVVGDGPQLAALRSLYRQAIFAGAQYGAELANFYAAADVFVFPSLTDTFGLVILEALASGTPVAGFPVTGPADIFEAAGTQAIGALDRDLCRAVERALLVPRKSCRAFAEGCSWAAASEQFLANLVPAQHPVE